jgi:hypothetical protein
MENYDFQIVCFNGAHRTEHSEKTDMMAVHPITEKCEKFIQKYCAENHIACIGGVALTEGVDGNLTTALENNGFKEAWTCFTDEFNLRATTKTWDVSELLPDNYYTLNPTYKS